MHEDLTTNQICEFAELLNQQKQDLQRQLQDNQQNSAPVKLDQQSVGRVSRIDAIQQQQMAVANREQATFLVKQIEAALGRIDDDEYGYCLECGEPIGFARLQVQPYAGFCVGCQEAIEDKA